MRQPFTISEPSAFRKPEKRSEPYNRRHTSNASVPMASRKPVKVSVQYKERQPSLTSESN